MTYRCLIMVYAAWVEAISVGRPFCRVNQENIYELGRTTDNGQSGSGSLCAASCH